MADFEVYLCQDLVEDGQYCHYYSRYILHLLNTLLRLVHCYAHLSSVVQERNTCNNSFCVCVLACLFVG